MSDEKEGINPYAKMRERIEREVLEAMKDQELSRAKSDYKVIAYQRASVGRSLNEFRLLQAGELNPSDVALDLAMQSKGLHDALMSSIQGKLETQGIRENDLKTIDRIADLAKTTHLGIANYAHQKRLEEGASDKPKTAQMGILPRKIKAKQTTETKEIEMQYGEVVEQNQTINEEEIELVARK